MENGPIVERSNFRVAEFFNKAALRLGLALPIAVTFSSSATIFTTYLMFVFWLLGGRWKERFRVVRSSAILWALIPLILWTAAGILRDGNPEAIKYWFGHYPYIFILVLATLFRKKEDRSFLFSGMNLAIILCFLWAAAFGWYYSELDLEVFREKREHTIYLYRNTICFGMAIALWGGMWACLPYTSRHVPGIRRWLPRHWLDGMEIAARTPIYELFLAFFPERNSELRRHPTAIVFTLLRWGVVLFAFYAVVFINPSRTAQLAILAGYFLLLLKWSPRWGILGCALLGLVVLLAATPAGDVFRSELSRRLTANKSRFDKVEMGRIRQVLAGKMSLEEFSQTEYTRPGTYLLLAPHVVEKPMFGYGMKKGRELVEEHTKYVDPHCEFLYIMIQQGIVGLIFFLFWMLSLFLPSRLDNTPWSRFALYVALLVWIDCLFNNAMSYHRETFLLCISIALVAAAESDRRCDSLDALDHLR